MSDLRSDARRRCVTSRHAIVHGAGRTHSAEAVTTVLAVGLAAVALSLLPWMVGSVIAVVAVVVALVVQRRMIADLLAGVTLLLAQPYDAGEQIRVYLEDIGEVIDAEVLHVRLLRTTLCTGSGMFAVRNAHLLRA